MPVRALDPDGPDPRDGGQRRPRCRLLLLASHVADLGIPGGAVPGRGGDEVVVARHQRPRRDPGGAGQRHPDDGRCEREAPRPPRAGHRPARDTGRRQRRERPRPSVAIGVAGPVPTTADRAAGTVPNAITASDQEREGRWRARDPSTTMPGFGSAARPIPIGPSGDSAIGHDRRDPDRRPAVKATARIPAADSIPGRVMPERIEHRRIVPLPAHLTGDRLAREHERRRGRSRRDQSEAEGLQTNRVDHRSAAPSGCRQRIRPRRRSADPATGRAAPARRRRACVPGADLHDHARCRTFATSPSIASHHAGPAVTLLASS